MCALASSDSHQLATLQCPVCLELPLQEVYQCANGHIICAKCSEPLKQCPECRIAYSFGKVRCRILESILDSRPFDCPFKDAGCQEQMSRELIKAHSKNCVFSPSCKINNRVELCKLLGLSCDFTIQTYGNMKKIRDHFRLKHNFLIRSGPHVSVLMENVRGTSLSEDSMWTPIIVTLGGSENGPTFLLTTQYNKSFIHFLNFSLGGQTPNCPVQAYDTEYSLNNQLGELKELKWKSPVITIPNAAAMLKIRPHGISLDKLKENFMNQDGCVSVEVKMLTVTPPEFSAGATTDNVESTWILNMPLQVYTSTPSAVRNSDTSFKKARCDNCGKSPLNTVRYKCLQCVNYDLCVQCFKNHVHAEHIFVMIDSQLKNGKVMWKATYESGEKLEMKRAVIQESYPEGLANTNKDNLPKCENYMFPHPHTIRAEYICMECEEGSECRSICEGCMKRGTHKEHILIVTNTDRRREFVKHLFCKRVLPTNFGVTLY